MCFKLQGVELQIAKEDVPCYKVVIRIEAGVYHSQHQHYTYRLGKNYKAKMRFDGKYSNEYISKGLHSYQTLRKARKQIEELIHPDYVVIKCIIPTGAGYYKNGKPYHHYVSDRLQIVKDLG